MPIPSPEDMPDTKYPPFQLCSSTDLEAVTYRRQVPKLPNFEPAVLRLQVQQHYSYTSCSYTCLILLLNCNRNVRTVQTYNIRLLIIHEHLDFRVN